MEAFCTTDYEGIDCFISHRSQNCIFIFSKQQNGYSCVCYASYCETKPVICTVSCIVLAIYSLCCLKFTWDFHLRLLILNIHRSTDVLKWSFGTIFRMFPEKKLVISDVCICFIFLVPFLRYKMTFKLNFFLIYSSNWLNTRQDSSVKHQNRKMFGRSSAILSGNTFSQALRLKPKKNKNQPSWSCLHFISLFWFFLWMRGRFPYFSLPSCILKEKL